MDRYDKHYFERYALLTLYSVFPEWEAHFTRCERPDLQNETDSIGIEVTSSTPSYIREVDSYGQKLLGKEVSEKDEKRFRGDLFLTADRVAFAYSPIKGLEDSDKGPEIISSISHKRDIWEGYKEFDVRGVYVFTGTSIIDEEMLKKVEKSDAFSFFQLIFVNAMDKLYYYHNGWKKKEFTDEEMARFKKAALAAE
ncbi:MAG: hypothetical protein IKP38_08155 [Clostridia bacterium]|nr:hypothetical protein [Clostridia bacterium]